jgi:hypothetical protein
VQVFTDASLDQSVIVEIVVSTMLPPFNHNLNCGASSRYSEEQIVVGCVLQEHVDAVVSGASMQHIESEIVLSELQCGMLSASSSSCLLAMEATQ